MYVQAANAAAVASLTDALTSNPFATESTYALLARESVVNPALPAYPEGTVTVPVPFGVKSKLPFALVVVIALPSTVILSTSREVIPFKSVIVPPKEVSSLPIVIPSLANFPFAIEPAN